MVSDEVKQEIKRLFIEEGKTGKEIADIYGFSPAKVRNITRRIGGAKKYTKDRFQIGDSFANGNLVIIGDATSNKEKNGSMRQCYKIRCNTCKTESIVSRQHLVRKSKKVCANCMKIGKLHPRFGGYGELDLTFYHDMINGAKYRNLVFEPSIEYLWNLYLKQERKCALSGLDIGFDLETGSHLGRQPSASVDRIDSNIGYTLENIWWVHRDVNFMKQDYNLNEFLRWCKLVTLHQRGRSNYNNDEALVEWNHHKNWRGYGNIRSTLFTKFKQGAMQRKHEFKLEIQDFWNLFVQQRGLCALSGTPIYFNESWRNWSDRTASLDRIDSNLGYILDNVQWIHKDLNFMKHRLSQERFLYLSSLISRYKSN